MVEGMQVRYLGKTSKKHNDTRNNCNNKSRRLYKSLLAFHTDKAVVKMW